MRLPQGCPTSRSSQTGIQSNNGLPANEVALAAKQAKLTTAEVRSFTMNAPHHTPRRWRYWIAAIVTLVAVAGRAEKREPDLTGVYDDEGSVVTTATGNREDGASLHALLSLEFVPALARILHGQTAQVRFKHGVDSLLIEVIDRDDKVVWSGAWQHGDGFGIQEGRVILHFKPGKYGQDEFLLIFRNVTTHRLLELEVQRLTPTVFGPSMHPVGTYVFPRLPEEAGGEGKR